MVHVLKIEGYLTEPKFDLPHKRISQGNRDNSLNLLVYAWLIYNHWMMIIRKYGIAGAVFFLRLL